jgi:hypothetical protein
MNDFAVGDQDEENLDTRASLDRHWKAVEAGAVEAATRIYGEDAVLEFPQSSERVDGIEAIRARYEAGGPPVEFRLRSTLGQEDLWVNDYFTRRGGKAELTVSVMEFREGKVVRETRYVMPVEHFPEAGGDVA